MKIIFIKNIEDFNLKVEEQRKEVQIQLDYFTNNKSLSSNQRKKLFQSIEKRGKEISNYFKKINHL
ncbi:hypothetical protein ETU10_08475 [Apibacter muscae]|uniref:hypothetical protein n=1 Tax=Apibacter muscae TaxID=2509004 RepID=UPI0011AC303B|nr:hypothetical protein [Apibacter muscae]TWP23121.1 hypothetical protein ETU10_08475 [Apibacter muscae]